MRIYRWIIGICLGIALVILSVGTLLYGAFIKQWSGPTFRGIVKVIPVPAARLGFHWVRYSDYLAHLDAERKFFSSEAGKAPNVPRLTDLQVRQDTLERVIHVAAVEDFAKERQIVVTPLDVDRMYDSFLRQSGTSTTPEEFHKILQDQFGWTEDQFKRYFVQPALLEDALAKKKETETKDATAFSKELEARVLQPDVIRYLKIK